MILDFLKWNSIADASRYFDSFSCIFFRLENHYQFFMYLWHVKSLFFVIKRPIIIVSKQTKTFPKELFTRNIKEFFLPSKKNSSLQKVKFNHVNKLYVLSVLFFRIQKWRWWDHLTNIKCWNCTQVYSLPHFKIVLYCLFT